MSAFWLDAHWIWLLIAPLICLAAMAFRFHPAIALTAVAAAAGIVVAGLTITASHPAELSVATAQRHTVTVSGQVATDPKRQTSAVKAAWASASTSRFVLNMESFRDDEEIFTIAAPISVSCECEVAVGSRVAITGRISPDLRYGEHIAALRADGDIEVLAAPGAVNSAANALRSGLLDAVRGVDADAAAIIAGLSVGDESLQNAGLRADMQRSGLSHLTAVSGGNVSIVVVMTLIVVSVLGVGRRTRYVVVAFAIVGFVILVRPQPSVLRAAVMGSVVVLALLAGRPSRGISTLSVAVIGLLLLSPGLAISYGFALSTVATAGLIVFAPVLVAWCRRHRWLGRMPAPLLLALAATVAAQLTTAPIIALMDAPIGSASVIANLAAAPLVAPVTIGGLLIAAFAVVAMPLAEVLAHMVSLPASWIAWIAHRGASWPAIPLPTGFLGAVLWVAACVCVVVMPRRWLIAVVAVALCAALLAPLRRSGWPPPDWVMVSCDVGQGDAIVLRIDDASAVVVDVGPSADLIDRCLDELGVTQLPLIVLTHFHADHVDGFAGLADGRTLGHVLVTPVANPPAQEAKLREWEEQEGLLVHHAVPGERFSVGSTQWRVLWPRTTQIDDNPNNASVVLLAETHGVRALLPGDVEPEAQANIVAAEAPVKVDVIKVPHHGSRYQYPGLVAWSGARIALVSVGAGNSYGHPASATLDAWQAAGAVLGRTDLDGDLAVVRAASGELGLVSRGP